MMAGPDPKTEPSPTKDEIGETKTTGTEVDVPGQQSAGEERQEENPATEAENDEEKPQNGGEDGEEKTDEMPPPAPFEGGSLGGGI